MVTVKQRFTALESMIEELHALFDVWPGESEPLGIDGDVFDRAKLAIHEWIANLVQHADFGQHPPEIVLELWHEDAGVHVVIEDNSEGFDLEERLAECEENLDKYPERGMGLMMVQACAADWSYGAIDQEKNRLKFSVESGDDPWLNIPF